MKIQLVYPPMNEGLELSGSGWTPPLGLLSIATYLNNTNSKVDIEIMDGNIVPQENLEEKLDADIVGISTTVCNYSNCLNIAKQTKEKGSFVVLGGPYVTNQAELILRNRPYIDSVVIGEGELAIAKLAENRCNGNRIDNIPNLVYRKNGEIIKNKLVSLDIDNLPFLNYNLIETNIYFENFRKKYPKKDFLRPISYYSQKGCRWKESTGGCIFCAIPDQKFKKKNPQKVWAEIESLVDNHNIDYVYETADNFTNDIRWLREFAELKPEHINPAFEVCARANSINNETVNYLKDINTYEVFIGVESGDDGCLQKVHKGMSLNDIIRASRLLRKNKIRLFPSFILGLPGESEKSLKKTLQFAELLCEEGYVERMFAFRMTPLPGSPSYKMFFEIPQVKEKYAKSDILSIKELQCDWVKHFCEVDIDTLDSVINQIIKLKTNGNIQNNN